MWVTTEFRSGRQDKERTCASPATTVHWSTTGRATGRDETILGLVTGSWRSPELRQLFCELLGGTLAYYKGPGRVRNRAKRIEIRVRACMDVVKYRK